MLSSVYPAPQAHLCNWSSVRERVAGRCHWHNLLLATLVAVIALAASSAGAATMYVSSGTQSILQINSAGAVSPFATLPANSNPMGLAFDASGTLYVARSSADEIVKITPSGVVSHFATLPTGSNPTGLAFDAGGNLFVSDEATDQISRITAAGTVSLAATLPASSQPYGIAFHNGDLYIADNERVDRMSPNGTVSLFTNNLAGIPNDVTFDAAGNSYVSTSTFNTLYTFSDQIDKVTPAVNVSVLKILTVGSEPIGLLLDPDGNLFAADSATNQITRISADGLTTSPFVSSINTPEFMAFAPVPEPSTAGLLATGAIVLLQRSRKSPPANIS